MIAAKVKALADFVTGGEQASSLFREMVEALPVAIYTTDAEGRLTYFNPAAVTLSGRVPEIGNDHWCITWKIFLPDGTPLPHDQCPMAVALKGGQVQTGVECIAERPDGSRFWFTPCPAVLRGDGGRIIGGVNLLMDITDRKRAEGEADEQFRAIVETTPECVKMVASDGTLLHMNSAGLAMVGASSADAVTGKNVYELVAPEDRDRFREFNESICQGSNGTLEFDITGLRGVRRRLETHAAALRHSDGSTVQLAITRDVSERKEAERAVLLLGSIVDSSDDAIISKDLNGIITSWNTGAERLFGYTAAEVIGKPVTILIPFDRLDEEPKILSRLRRGERVDHFETIRKCKDGSLLDISLTISPVKDKRGNIVGVSKIARDITERRHREKALRQANEALARSNADLQQFAYSASHDLQEPLQEWLRPHSRSIKREFGGQLGPNGDEYIGYTIQGAVRMEHLLRDLRAYTLASSTGQEPSEDVDADQILDKVLAALEPAIKESGGSITRSKLPRVRIHEFQLEQLFQNLVGNSIRYRAPDPLRIHVAAERRDSGWLFSVQDNGIGIAPQYKEQIFEIFKRLHSAAAYPGTGMGLAICQRIVERVGGRIWVESTLGSGATFFFTIPAGEN